MSVPVWNRDVRVGAIVFWGIPRFALDDATAHDLAVIASWCVPALASASWHPEAAASGALEVK